MPAITRTELLTHVETAFVDGPTTRDRLLAYAIGSHARPEVVAALERLPDKAYATVRDLWYHLPDIPVSA